MLTAGRNVRRFGLSVLAAGFFAGALVAARCSEAGDISSEGALRVYVVADVHVGQNDRGEAMRGFVDMCNREMPDVVLDLGDTIQGTVTRLYRKGTAREAALAQQSDWLSAWHAIDVLDKEVALGNRDVDTRYPLNEEDWIPALGYEERPARGGTKLQRSFLVEKDNVSALFVVLCTYTHDEKSTMEWIRGRTGRFEGDLIVFASHHAEIYPRIRELLLEVRPAAQPLFLYGHEHGPDTVTRTRSTPGREELYFPAYLVTPLMRSGIAAKFVLSPGGEYEVLRIDVENGIIGSAVVN